MISEGADVCSLKGGVYPSFVWVLEDEHGGVVADTNQNKKKIICVFTSKAQAKLFKQDAGLASGCLPKKYEFDDFAEKFIKLGFEKALVNPRYGPGYVWIIDLNRIFVS